MPWAPVLGLVMNGTGRLQDSACRTHGRYRQAEEEGGPSASAPMGAEGVRRHLSRFVFLLRIEKLQ